MISKQEAYDASTEYFNGDTLAATVWADKYGEKDGDDMSELTPLGMAERTPLDMHVRLSKEIARVELTYDNSLHANELLSLMDKFKYIVPQGRIMAGLGVEKSYRSLSNCLVLPTPYDSYSSIMYTDTMMVSSAKRGCGYGVDMSKIAPKGRVVSNAANTSTGVVPFMERYSNSTREVGQDSRRGACLLGIDVFHPEVLSFVHAKKDRKKVTGANISVKCNDNFFESVRDDKDFDLTFEDKVYDTVKAKSIFKEIIGMAHDNAEPGIFMWDRIINYDPSSVYPDHEITLTNACGEQPMSSYDTCRLLVTNLYSYVDKPFTDDATFNEELFIDHVHKMMRIGDDVIDLEVEYVSRIIDKVKSDDEPEEQKAIELLLWENVRAKALKGRRLGCGITGLADMLAAMGIRYGSEESKTFVKYVMDIKLRAELEASIDLAEERGAFPDFDFSKEYTDGVGNNDFYKFIGEKYPDLIERMAKVGRRHINWNTIAPVGSTSLLTQTSSGCEPVFMPIHTRKRKVADKEKCDFVDEVGDMFEEHVVVHKPLQDYFNINGIVTTKENIAKHVANSPYAGATSHDISWKDRVDLQSIMQQYTTSAISSTINLPEHITKAEVEKIYMYAWEKGCKGMTIYRTGSRTGVLNAVSEEKAVDTSNGRPKRQTSLKCDVYHKTVLKKDMVILVGLQDNKPYEIWAFPSKGIIANKVSSGHITRIKSGHYALEYMVGDKKHTVDNITSLLNENEQNETRTYSTMLCFGVPVDEIRKQIASFATVTSQQKAIERVLGNYVNDENSVGVCPECGGEVRYEAGCKSCVIVDGQLANLYLYCIYFYFLRQLVLFITPIVLSLQKLIIYGRRERVNYK